MNLLRRATCYANAGDASPAPIRPVAKSEVAIADEMIFFIFMVLTYLRILAVLIGGHFKPNQ